MTGMLLLRNPMLYFGKNTAEGRQAVRQLASISDGMRLNFIDDDDGEIGAGKRNFY